MGSPRITALGGLLPAFALVLLLTACASLPPVSVAAPGSQATSTEPQALALEQSLYRLTYDGGEGRVGLRVVLRVGVGERFQLVASDVAGRRVWSLDADSNGVVLVDHRAQRFCRGGADIRLEELHPSELPLAALPRILKGELPIAGPSLDGEDAEQDFNDATGNRWRAAHEGGRLVSWLLYDGDKPVLWWDRQPEGGILSRHGGEQYRWTQVVAERSSRPLLNVVPDGFEEGVCNE